MPVQGTTQHNWISYGSDLRDALAATDPGMTQFRRAARATISAILATLLLFRVIHWFHEPKTVAFVGIFIAILGSMLVNDPTPRQQRITTLLCPFRRCFLSR